MQVQPLPDALAVLRGLKMKKRKSVVNRLQKLIKTYERKLASRKDPDHKKWVAYRLNRLRCALKKREKGKEQKDRERAKE